MIILIQYFSLSRLRFRTTIPPYSSKTGLLFPRPLFVYVRLCRCKGLTSRAFICSSVALASLPAIAPRRPPLLPLADPRFKVIGCVAKKSLGDQIGRAFEPLL
jgi:hypothetical protein